MEQQEGSSSQQSLECDHDETEGKHEGAAYEKTKVEGKRSASEEDDDPGDEHMPRKHGDKEAEHREENVRGDGEICLRGIGSGERRARNPEHRHDGHGREKVDPDSPEASTDDLEGSKRSHQEKFHGAGEAFGAEAVSARKRDAKNDDRSENVLRGGKVFTGFVERNSELDEDYEDAPSPFGEASGP